MWLYLVNIYDIEAIQRGVGQFLFYALVLAGAILVIDHYVENARKGPRK